MQPVQLLDENEVYLKATKIYADLCQSRGITFEQPNMAASYLDDNIFYLWSTHRMLAAFKIVGSNLFCQDPHPTYSQL